VAQFDVKYGIDKSQSVIMIIPLEWSFTQSAISQLTILFSSGFNRSSVTAAKDSLYTLITQNFVSPIIIMETYTESIFHAQAQNADTSTKII
jgi:hypothetical protein